MMRASSALRHSYMIHIAAALAFSVCPAVAGTEAPSLEELVEMRQIGALSISPDGRYVAFRQLDRDLAANTSHVQWYRVPISGDAQPTPLGGRSDPIWMPLYTFVEKGISKWGDTSDRLYVLQQFASAVQVHEIGPDGFDIPATRDEADVLFFTISEDGRTLSYDVGNAREAIQAAQTAEARTGIHLDKGVMTNGLPITGGFRIGDREVAIRRAPGGKAVVAHAGPIRSKSIALAAEDKHTSARGMRSSQVILESADPIIGQKSLRARHGNLSVQLVSIDAPDSLLGYGRYRVSAVLNGIRRDCTAPFCEGLSPELRQVAINDETGEVVVLYEKAFSARSIVYGWTPVTGTTRIIFNAAGSLDGGEGYGLLANDAAGVSSCPKAGRYLVCVHAGPTQPPRLIRLDLTSGETKILADPNRDLGVKRFSPATFMEWQDDEGHAASGVLLLPSDRPAIGLPLVITTYRCRGFLSGSISMLASEHSLVQDGFAVLCANNNNANQVTYDAQGRRIPISGIKAALASYEAVIDDLSRRGIVDRAKIGISGHSFGDMTIAYGISHTDLFAVAVMGTGYAFDPATFMMAAPTHDGWQRGLADGHGLPQPTEDPEGLWAEISAPRHAASIRTPVLMLPPENEWLYGLQLYANMRYRRIPADMYIFPGEGHSVSREPAHQYWRNRRARDWFGFWLLGKDTGSPDTAGQFEHWKSLRVEHSQAGHAGP